MNVLTLASEFDRCEAHMVASLAHQGIHVVAALEPQQRYGDILYNTPILIEEVICRGRFDPISIRKIRSIIKRHKIDIAHAFSARALSNLLFATIGLPVKHVAYRGTMGHLHHWDPTSWLSFLNPRLNKIICVSHAVETYLHTMGIPHERTTTIHKGHDVTWYNKTSSFHLSELGIPDDAFVVGCVANMRPVKGVHVLVDALRHLPSNLPIHLLLVGEVRDGRILSQIERSPYRSQIHLAGFRSDAPSVIAQCHTFVMPSIEREGLPKALIEAMIKSVPPIVTDVGGMPEIVRDEIEGLIVPPSDPQALSRALYRLYSDNALRLRLKSATLPRIATSFTIQETTEKTLAVYSSLLQS